MPLSKPSSLPQKSSLLHAWSWQGGALLPSLGGVPLTDRGFRYGQHLFETLAVRGGRVFFLEEHWERLVRAAVRHHFPISSLWYQGISDFFEKNLLEEGIVRIYLTAGEGAPASPIEQPQLFLFWEESIFPSEQQRQQGIALVSLDRPIGTTAWGEKSGNYWEHLTALEAARQAGAEEGLVFDRDGFLISAAMANVVLWLNDGRMITPPRARGARDGVMLDQIRQHVPALLSADLKRDDLKNVVALAICNSRLGVMPVAALDGEPVAQYQLASDLVKR